MKPKKKPVTKSGSATRKVIKKKLKSKKKPVSSSSKPKATRRIKSPVKSKKKAGPPISNQQAKFKPGTENEQGHQSFDKMIQPGWINDTLILGLLDKIREQENRTVFEFKLNNKTFDAWSANTWRDANKQLLKEDCSYVVKGTMFAETKSTKFDRSSNSNFKYKVRLSQIEIIGETQERKTMDVKNALGPFLEMNSLIKSKKTFNLTVQDVEIMSGDVRRYMGCEVCFGGLSIKNKKNEFHCKKCRQYYKERRVCILIRNLKLRDKQDNILDNVLCFQRDCEALFGKELVEQLCNSSSDLDARYELESIQGTIIKADIKRQAPTRSKTKAFNIAKTVIDKLEVIKMHRSKNYETFENRVKKVLTTHKNVPVAITRPGLVCSCLEDEDDVDDVEISLSPMECCHEEISSITVAPQTHFNPKSIYELKPTRHGRWIGLALIINIMNIENDPNPRTGSEKDVRRLKRMFLKLGVKVFQEKDIRDLNKAEYFTKVRDFKNELINGNYSSLFLVVMSHGRLYTVRLSDRSLLGVYKDILPLFGEKQFPEFQGKPKICFFNTCQSMSIETEKNIKRKVDELNETWDVNKQELVINILECYPCMPGITSKRSSKKGSYFIQTVADVFERFYTTMHIEEMMKKVQQKMQYLGLGNTNVAVYKPMVFSKMFYFPAAINGTQMDTDE